MKPRGIQLGLWSRVIIAVVIIALFLAIKPIRNMLASGLLVVIKPVHSLSTYINQHAVWTWNTTSVRSENEMLRSQNEKITLKLAETQARIAASNSLDHLESFLETIKQNRVTAAIIGFSSDPGDLKFIINQGTSAGLRQGMPVISDYGFLIGKVESVEENKAVIRQINDSQSRILTRAGNDKKSPGVTRGKQGITLEMNYIPVDDDVRVGDVVTTSGAESGVPPDLVIGTVQDVVVRPGELFKAATVFTPVRIGTLSVVAVIMGS